VLLVYYYIFSYYFTFYIILAHTPSYPPYFIFFFNYSCHHHALHSFPTRRSSDLIIISQNRLEIIRAHDDLCALKICYTRSRWFIDRKSTRLNSKSRFDLVCRLLLEKKNKKKI